MRINSERSKSLGEVGERLTPKLLQSGGFVAVKNLNEIRVNFPYADFYAERDGRRYVIAVKARNMYEVSGSLNSRYKLGKKVYEFAQKASKQFDAIPAFLVIQLDNRNGTYNGYFGELELLKGNNAVLMSERHLSRYECLGKDVKSGFNFSELKNVY